MARKVAIVGTGLIGRGWAVAFARGGWNVSLWDLAPNSAKAALAAIEQSLADLVEAGLMDRQGRANAVVELCRDVETAVEGADHVQESVPEDLKVKNTVFHMLDRIADPSAAIASSASTIAGSLFLADIPGRARCIVAHPANPPHLMPVVEVVPSPWHETEFVQEINATFASIGQVPVLIRKEIEGFVMNRLQTAVVCEAVALVAQGVIDPDGLDTVMTHSLGLRWALVGPFETMDLNAPDGFYDYATRYGALYQAMARQLSVAEPWTDETLRTIEAARRKEFPKEQLAQRMRWRDRTLMELLKLKSTTKPERKLTTQ